MAQTALRSVRFRDMIYSCITLADNTGNWNSPRSEVAPLVTIDKLKRLSDTSGKWHFFLGGLFYLIALKKILRRISRIRHMTYLDFVEL